MFYNARYYDPALGRFLQADSIVPTTSHRSLTVDFHETGFRARLAGENNQSFWFQMSGRQRQQATPPWGPVNPQSLNRYSYVNNNPLNYVDPSGHTAYLDPAQTAALIVDLDILVMDLNRLLDGYKKGLLTMSAVLGYLAKETMEKLSPIGKELLKGLLKGFATRIALYTVIAQVAFVAIMEDGIAWIKTFNLYLRQAAVGGKGAAITYDNGDFGFLDRGTGHLAYLDKPWWLGAPGDPFTIGKAFGNWRGGFVFCADFPNGHPDVNC